MQHLKITSPFWILPPPVKTVLCQLTYTTNRQINISTCPQQSCHPKHCTNSIPYSQALRIKRICSNEQTTNKRLGELKCHLKKRGCNNASINHCFNKASGIDRKDLIQYKEKNANNRVPFVITYHPALSNLSSIAHEHWTTIQKHPELCKIFKEPPVLAFRKPTSLKDILVRADISPRSAYNGQCSKCDSRRCMTCKNIQCTQKFSSTHTGEKYTAMPTARQKILSTSWNVQFVVFNTSEKLNNNLVNAWMATEAMQIANLTFHSADISDRRATMILLAN